MPLFGLPQGDTPLLLAMTTVIELAKLVIVAYWLWRWNKDIDEQQRYLDEQDRILDERARESERRHAESMKQLRALIERTSGGPRPDLSGG